MKIAVVTRYFPSSGEPVAGRSLYETLRVVARDADVQVFYPNASYPSLFKPRHRLYKELDRDFRTPDVKVSYYNYHALPLISRPLNAQMAYHALFRHVRAFAPDVVFGCFLYPAGYTALKIGRKLGVPVMEMSIGSDINRIGDPISARYTRSVLREADCLVTVSDDLRRKAVAMGAPPERAHAVINGCDLSVFHVGDRGQAREKLKIDPAYEVVVFVGSIMTTKGVRELVEAAVALHANRPRLHVYFVGDGPELAMIDAAIRNDNAEGYIHLVPECGFREVAEWMTAADVVTLPSYMEGCPNVVIEALGCGRPVVATNVGGIPELVNENCGFLVPPRDPRELAQALGSALDRTWDASAISARWGRDWSAPAAELLALFEAMVRNRKGAARG